MMASSRVTCGLCDNIGVIDDPLVEGRLKKCPECDNSIVSGVAQECVADICAGDKVEEIIARVEKQQEIVIPYWLNKKEKDAFDDSIIKKLTSITQTQE